MREIKFRCYGKPVDDIYCEYPLVAEDNGQTLNKLFKDDSVIFMQYTGLKDKNGVEIYEGDIVKFKALLGLRTQQVVYDAPTFKIKDYHYDYWDRDIGEDLEVIGNIYENKELLNDNS